MYATFISPADLSQEIRSGNKLLIFDTRFSLSDTEFGRRSYLEAHIPDALYAHLDLDLSAPVIPRVSGRHPLPQPDFFTERLRLWGLTPETQVVVYDDDSGGIAARLWWMIRWAGHDAVAVLDGGWRAWRDFGGESSAQLPRAVKSDFIPKFLTGMDKNLGEVTAMRSDGVGLLVDSRTADRYAGENETIDPVAGHIPGAISASYKNAVHPNGTSLSESELRGYFNEILKGEDPKNVVFYCGSGVTACRNVLAMEHAGLHGSKIYPGSWSEWIQHRNEIATGNSP